MDLAVVAILFAFLAWGAWHGALRQLLGLLVLCLAFLGAPWISPHLEGTLRKLVDVTPDDLAVLSWSFAFLIVAVAGGVLLHAVRGPVSRARVGGVLDRVLGGVVGAAKGAVVVGLVAYGVLVWYERTEPPGIVRSLRESRTADALARAHRRLESWLRLPDPVERRIDEVDRRVGVEGGP